ncbi:hypothetical protein KBB96_16085 [Luteolibacter ambystomatis]|uniref:Uncharacterized protein n=1 Tax=Luteolibacter ambystomatis TaxID=2824561 RepID=A0A975G7U8_9BACT|nr:hypothetical protein [Luteolibacter ambystomatis]QUE50376.1 hypothetical protein KBB96_16085 [Luteolibacter ambystomatis]
MMIRLSLAVAIAAGGLLLTSCDPYGPPPGYGPRSPYDAPGPRAPGPRQMRGDGYGNGDPYGPNDGGYGNGYGQGGDSGYGRDGGYGGGSRGGDPYGSNDGGGYTENPTPRTNPPSTGGSSGSGTGSGKKDYPTATKTANPGRVLSPYPPYNVINVEDIKSGKLAKDPSTGEIFRVP